MRDLLGCVVLYNDEGRGNASVAATSASGPDGPEVVGIPLAGVGRGATVAARMGLVDIVSGWILAFDRAHPDLHAWLEGHFHAFGLHGPLVRHSLKMRVVPAALVVTATLAVLLAIVVIRSTRRALARRRTPAV
jgi:hypothetical protein